MRSTNAYSLGMYAAFACSFRRFRQDKLLFPVSLCTITAAAAVLMTLGCGTTHATLDIVGPATVRAGVPFTITVNVIYEAKPDTVINSAIHFTSSDSAAILPPNYYFTPADSGSHTWTNGVTLMTAGNQTITATIIMATGITGTATIEVSNPASAARFPSKRPSSALRILGVFCTRSA